MQVEKISKLNPDFELALEQLSIATRNMNLAEFQGEVLLRREYLEYLNMLTSSYRMIAYFARRPEEAYEKNPRR